MGTKISALSAAVSVGQNDLFPIVQSGTTLKASISQLNIVSVKDGTDPTKVLNFDVSAIPTATTRTLTANSSGSFVAGSTTQVQFNNAGVFGGMSGTTWDDTNRNLDIGFAGSANYPNTLTISNYTNGGGGAGFTARRSRGTTVGTGTAINSGDRLAFFQGQGWAAGLGAWETGALIEVFADDTTGGHVHGRWVLSTLNSSNVMTEALRLDFTQNATFAGKQIFASTNTAGGTTGDQTINKASGTVNFAAVATSLVVTNSLVTTSSLVFCTIRTNDSTALIKNVVPGSGSFTINLNVGATAETSVGFLVVN